VEQLPQYQVQQTGTVEIKTPTPTGTGAGINAVATRVTVSNLRAQFEVPVKLKGYTVAALPTGSQGDVAFVTDALAPAFLTTVVGGGAVVTMVFFDGTNWIVN